MTKIIETETFTVNADNSLMVTRIVDFLEGTEPFYFITETQTVAKNYVNKDEYRAQKENLVSEGKIEMARATAKIEEAEKILRELDRLAELEKLSAPGV